jgi:hypothetical protein
MAMTLLTAAAVLAQPPDEAGVAPGAPVPDTRPGTAFADPRVAELQRTATDIQHDLSSLTDQIHAAATALDQATAVATDARRERADADAAVAARQAEMDHYALTAMADHGGPNQLQVLLAARSPRDWLDGASLVARVQESTAEDVTAAVHRQRAATAAERTAVSAAKAAAVRKADLDRRDGDATNRAAAITGEFRAKLTATNTAVVAQQQAQRARDTQTAANWHDYLAKLAAHEPVQALPPPVVNAISAAVDALGKPYAPERGATNPTAPGRPPPAPGDSPDSYSCDGLTRRAYGLTGSPADQMAVLAPVTDPQPGDLVFLGPARYGVQGVGIVLDPRTMVTADARLVSVVVADIPGSDTVLGYARPTLPHRPPRPVPQRTDDGLRWRCGGVDLPTGAWSGYPNGMIPGTALCPIGIGDHRLRCDAAQAFQLLSAGFARAFGRPLCVTDSYRTFEEQVRLYGAKPALAAVPGTSNHGWGLAVDMCGGAQSFGTPEHRWLEADAGGFGWINPPWARPGRGREEPWHWEFG